MLHPGINATYLDLQWGDVMKVSEMAVWYAARTMRWSAKPHGSYASWSLNEATGSCSWGQGEYHYG